jgi:hypothetical protein
MSGAFSISVCIISVIIYQGLPFYPTVWYSADMKQFRTQLAVFFAVFLLTAPLVSAQSAVKQTPAPAPVSISAGMDTTEPVVVRKARVEAGLRDMLTRFGTAYARTQFALSRIAPNPLAQAEITKAGTALQEAKALLDGFAASSITGADESVTLALKAKALATEEKLQAARTSILGALQAIRLTIPQ